MDYCTGVHYFEFISKARKGYSHALEPVCRQWNLTRNALDVLLFLYNQPEYDRAVDIVSRRCIAKSHVSLSVMDLEHRGLLTRHFVEGDRRTAHLKLTDGGVAIARQGRAAQQHYFDALFSGISEAEMEQWRRMIERVFANMEQMERDTTHSTERGI